MTAIEKKPDKILHPPFNRGGTIKSTSIVPVVCVFLPEKCEYGVPLKMI